MAGVTTNNGWDYPTSTDYVKDGATAIQTLATDIDTSVGTGLLAWQSWSPTLSGGWANGNGVWDAKYVKLGKTVTFNAQFTIGSTTTKGSNILFSLPVTSKDSYFLSFDAFCSPNAQLIAFRNATTTGNIVCINSAGTYATRATITATVPLTWATNDTITIRGTYEVA